MSTLMAVFAHPDDETFICGGTLAKYAVEGHRVVLVCATKGEMGRRMGDPPIVTRETIAQLREQELIDACEALGIANLYFLGLRDKTLEIQPFNELVETVYQHMAREQPTAVVTFHERFGGHPDHCTIGAAAARAFARYGARRSDARLFFVAWSHMVHHAEDYGFDRSQFVEIRVAQQLTQKLRAYRAHRTQSEIMEWLWRRDEVAERKLATREYFIPATLQSPSPTEGLMA